MLLLRHLQTHGRLIQSQKSILKKNERTTEPNATIKYDFDHEKYSIIYNENELNQYGNTRGYQIFPVHKMKEVYQTIILLQ